MTDLNCGVLRHPQVDFSDVRKPLSELHTTAANAVELNNELRAYDWPNTDLVLIDAAEAPCLSGLHNASSGVYTILTDGYLLTQRFACALTAMQARIEAAKFSGRHLVFVCDFGNEVNCLSSFIGFASDVKRLQVQHPFGFIIVDNNHCQGLMQEAVNIKTGNLVTV